MNNYLNPLSIEEVKKASIDKDLAIEKGLIKDDNYNMYLQVQALYKKLFDCYLNEKIKPNNLDKEILIKNLKIRCLTEKESNIYQKWSSLDSKYIYVRNFFYIERLNIEDLNLFKQVIIEKKDYIDKLLAIVFNTFKEVIKIDYEGVKTKKYRVFYGSVNPAYEFYNDSLVLFVKYKVLSQNDESTYIDNKVDAINFFKNLKLNIDKNLSETLQCNVELAFYDFKGEK